MAASFPYVTANINSALTPESVGARSILLVGQMVSGTASSGALVEDLISEAEFNLIDKDRSGFITWNEAVNSPSKNWTE